MRRSCVVLAGLLAPVTLSAQLPEGSTRGLGMGGAYTAIARGYEAVRWNPAMLAANGRPSFSLALPQGALELGSNTWGFGDFRRYSERYLTDADKQDLLDRISLDDSVLTLRSIGGVTPIAISIGPFAVAIGTSGHADMSLGRDAVELVLNGNAARSGPGDFFTARGSNARGWAATTLAGSFARALNIGPGRLSLGVTYKHITGHFLGRAAETASSFQVNPAFAASAAGHAIYTGYSSDYEFSGLGLSGEARAGNGFGVDLGGVLQFGGRSLTLSAVFVNALGSMNWDVDRFRYERAVYSVTETNGEVTDTRDVTTLTTANQIANDPAARALRDALLANSDFSRYLRGGVALRTGGLTLAGDVILRLTEGLDRVPSQQIAGGAEYVLLGFLPLRAGIATDFKNVGLSAGSGLRLLGVNLDLSIAKIEGDDRPGVIVGAGLALIF
jgi:hypothetical protein